MKPCPRCQEPIAGNKRRCPSCGLYFHNSFDLTAGHPEGRKYLGRIIGGHFRTISILAYGGHGMVLLVRHIKLQRKNLFALKLLRPELSQDDMFRNRFLREVEIIYSFSHPNIVPIREFGETEENELYFTMDFCFGKPLDQAMMHGKPFSLKSIMLITEDILKGLHYAHKNGIVHRDMKPANIFLQETGHSLISRILDFGIAKPADTGGIELTRGENILGTPAYMSPEQILGKNLDCRTDLYALGVVLYRLVAGKPPFKGRTGHEILAGHLRDTPASLKRIKPDTPVEVSNLVERLLEKNPEDRPKSAEILRQEIIKIRRSIYGKKSKNSPATRKTKKRKKIYAMALSVFALLIGGALFMGLPLNKGEGIPSAQAGKQSPETKRGVVRNKVANSCKWCGRGLTSSEKKKGICTSCLNKAKWCPFCKIIYPSDIVTCPDCGQVLMSYSDRNKKQSFQEKVYSPPAPVSKSESANNQAPEPAHVTNNGPGTALESAAEPAPVITGKPVRTRHPLRNIRKAPSWLRKRIVNRFRR